MSAKDLYHEACVHALQKDGWTITHDPLTVDSVFEEAIGQMLLRHSHLRLIVFDPISEVIVLWKD